MLKMWKSLLGVLVVLSASSWGYVIKQDNTLLFYFDKAVVTVLSRNAGSDSASNSRIEYNKSNTVIDYQVTSADTQIDVKLDFKRNDTEGQDKIQSFVLDLTLTETPRQYVIMSNVNATVKGPSFQGLDSSIRLLTEIPLETPKDRSFHCSHFGKLFPDFEANSKLNNFTITVEFFGLQLQAFNGTGTSESFGESYDCVGYFTPGIWSGIFVAIILISVITWGLAMIMDVKTMDKFDDAKGKVISFGGAE